MALMKNNGPIIDPALCRCCRAIKKCRVLTVEYTWMEQKEVYADMIMDCFGILVRKKKNSTILPHVAGFARNIYLYYDNNINYTNMFIIFFTSKTFICTTDTMIE